MEDQFKLKDKVKDTITGFAGTITGIWTSITNSPRALVEGMDSTGRPVEVWIDFARLEKF